MDILKSEGGVVSCTAKQRADLLPPEEDNSGAGRNLAASGEYSVFFK